MGTGICSLVVCCGFLRLVLVLLVVVEGKVVVDMVVRLVVVLVLVGLEVVVDFCILLGPMYVLDLFLCRWRRICAVAMLEGGWVLVWRWFQIPPADILLH